MQRLTLCSRRSTLFNSNKMIVSYTKTHDLFYKTRCTHKLNLLYTAMRWDRRIAFFKEFKNFQAGDSRRLLLCQCENRHIVLQLWLTTTAHFTNEARKSVKPWNNYLHITLSHASKVSQIYPGCYCAPKKLF